MHRDLSLAEMSRLAALFHSSKQFVRSDNLAPVDVNILPMTVTLESGNVDAAVLALLQHIRLHPILAREIVLSVLKAGMDGTTIKPETCRPPTAPDTEPGADNGRPTE